ncbi:MAG TPA: hypothetical protein VMT63_03620 [Bacteroidales bacterium]|nr:hypothetical protein [Bacteroidales bacterium]
MKIKIALTVLLTYLFTLNLSAQNLLGYKLKEIKSYMRENQKTMRFQGLTFNSTFKYAKYADVDGNQTTLFLFTADTVCKGIRMICDKSLEQHMISEMDSRYKKQGKNSWSEEKDGKTYLIELREEDFSFNVTITLKD